jgi:hypothetical protein
MQQALGEFEPPIHTAGESLSFLFGAIREAYTSKHFGHACFQSCTV